MNILVTGGAGYIGSVLSEELVADGHRVVVYDNLYKGHRDAVHEAAIFVHADLLCTPVLMQVIREHDIDAVMHLAAESLVGESMTEPARYYRSNVEASLALMNAMREADVRAIVFSSTAAVYGEPEIGPEGARLAENAPTRPTSTYGDTKLAIERALYWYDGAYGIRYASLRYFNAAGASEHSGEQHEPETHLIPLVLEVAAGVRPEIVIFGDDYPTADGTCVRDYIHVADLASAHRVALRSLVGARSRSAIYNLGCGGGYSVKEVIETARRVTGRPIPVRVGPRRPGDPAVLVASSERIEHELGWRPAHQDLGEIIESAWRWSCNRRAP